MEVDQKGALVLTWTDKPVLASSNVKAFTRFVDSPKLEKKSGMVYVSWPGNNGGYNEFHLENGRLVGENSTRDYKGNFTKAPE